MKNINRRDFLKIFGGATVASSAVLTACTGKNAQETTADAQEPPIGKMTMRKNPNTGDEFSLLGYGMMRLPVLPKKEDTDPDVIDQEMVNKQVDYAIEHGVNYFDTSPAYCQGNSEPATGIALSRHKRNEYFVATKLSNFAPETWSREESQKMFRSSMEYLKDIAREIYDLKTIPCNECQYCMPCPYGINIPAIFVHYNKMIKEGLMPHRRESEEYSKQRRAYLYCNHL